MKMNHQRKLTCIMRRPRGAFTLLELMIVLVIIAILGTIVTINLVGAADKARETKTRANMRTILAALKMYRASFSAYPPTQGGLQLLAQQNLFGQPEVPKDGWDRDFDYYSPAPESEFVLISYGANGKDDGGNKDEGAPGDDIWAYPDRELP